MTRALCKDCAYFELDGYVKPNGRCKRYPPVVLVDDHAIFSVWPEVDAEDYCGEFVKDEKNDPTTTV